MHRLVLASCLALLSLFPALAQEHPIRTIARGVSAQGLAADSQGNLYFSSGAADRVFLLRRGEGARPGIFAGSGEAGSPGDGGAATTAELALAPENFPAPSGVAVDAAGNVFIADSQNSTVRRVGGGGSTEPGIIRSVAGRWAGASNVSLREPAGLAVDRVGNLYIADYAGNAVDVLDANSGELALLANIVRPGAIAVDPSGEHVYVARAAAGQVMEFDLRGRAGEIIAGRGAPPAAAFEGAPAGLALNAAGNLFIADAAANVIRRLDARTGTLSIVAGTGQRGDSGDDGPAMRAQLNSPGAIAFDRAGNLFLADTGNHALREIAHLGATQPTSSGVSLSPASLSYGPQLVGGTSAPQTTVLTNNTASTLTITSISFAAANVPPCASAPSDFTQANSCGTSLAAGANCNINVTFAPTATGARCATLEVSDSDPSSPQTAALAGTGDDFELEAASGGSTTATVSAGQTASYSLAVVPDNTFSGPVSIVCPTNPPRTITCTANPISVNVTAGTPAPFSIMLATQMRVGAAPAARPNLARGFFLAALALLALVLYSRRRRMLVPACAAVAALAMLACYHSPAPPPSGTIAGSYVITVSATAQNAGRAITLTLNVQ